MKTMNMKTNSFAFLISLLMLLASCDHDTLPVYEDVDRIYFEYASGQGTVDQRDVKLGYDNPIKNDSTIGIRVRLLGRVSNEDRPLNAELVADESSAILGTDIDILPSLMKAGKAIDTLFVKLKTSKKIETKTILARIRLLPNAYFHVDTETFAGNGKNSLEYNIYFDAKMDMPSLWALTNASGARPNCNDYFGAYSNMKFKVICEACGVDREYFTYHPIYDADGKDTNTPKKELDLRIPSALSYGWVALCNRYLKAYKDSHNGQDMLDENGAVIKFPFSWT